MRTDIDIFFRLAKNPEVQERLYREIMRELPHKDSKLEERTVERMPYLKAVLKETLRLHSPAPLNARSLNRSFELGGYEFAPSKKFYLSGFLTCLSWSHRNVNKIYFFLVFNY